MIKTMKNPHTPLVIFSILFNLALFSGNAQVITDENTYLINQYFQLNKESSLLENNVASPTNNKQAQSNSVTLNQIGNNNQIDIKIIGNCTH